MLKKRQETFNDGTMDVCMVSDRKITKTLLTGLRFGNKTVGVTRFYQAKLADDKIDRLISIPINGIVRSSCLILIDGEQYTVTQTQEKYDTLPPTILLSIRKAVPAYKDMRKETVK